MNYSTHQRPPESRNAAPPKPGHCGSSAQTRGTAQPPQNSGCSTARQARLLPAIDPVLLPPAVDRRLAHPDLSGNHTDRPARPDKLNYPPAELRRIRPRHPTIPFPEASILINRDQKTGTRSLRRERGRPHLLAGTPASTALPGVGRGSASTTLRLSSRCVPRRTAVIAESPGNCNLPLVSSAALSYDGCRNQPAWRHETDSSGGCPGGWAAADPLSK